MNQGDVLIVSLQQTPSKNPSNIFNPLSIRSGLPISQQELNMVISRYNSIYSKYLTDRSRYRLMFLLFLITIVGISELGYIFYNNGNIFYLVGCIACGMVTLLIIFYGLKLEKYEPALFQLTYQLNSEYQQRGLLFQFLKKPVGQIDYYEDKKYKRSSPINAFHLDIYWTMPGSSPSLPPTVYVQQ
ncbi:hypothetical protein HDV06_004169 [Boothiomyces sp. JEL0866]|nr:hypothetical protein HDV06_004169 [Boothiomyces sp. JEL0866]